MILGYALRSTDGRRIAAEVFRVEAAAQDRDVEVLPARATGIVFERYAKSGPAA
jgi:hypothetical protein